MCSSTLHTAGQKDQGITDGEMQTFLHFGMVITMTFHQEEGKTVSHRSLQILEEGFIASNYGYFLALESITIPKKI
jgi:hypothetical protein